MGNGFSLVKFTNNLDRNKVLDGQPWFVRGKIYSLQCWKQHFDPAKENLYSVLLWVPLPRLPLELWNENILRTILKLVGKLSKLDPNSDEISKGLRVLRGGY